MMRKLIATLFIICGVGFVFCLIAAISALNQSDDEIRNYSDALLPAKIFLFKSRIGYEYGVFAEHYWEAVYEGNTSLASRILSSDDENIRSQIKNAKAANFYLPPNPKLDSKIMEEYSNILTRAPDIQRRASFRERFKDMMPYLGGAAVFAFLFWLVFKIKTKNMSCGGDSAEQRTWEGEKGEEIKRDERSWEGKDIDANLRSSAIKKKT
jgi:hypothetical protein